MGQMIQQQLQNGGSVTNIKQGFRFVRVGLLYGFNLMNMVARQQGYRAAAVIGSRFALAEIAKLPLLIRMTFQRRNGSRSRTQNPVLYSAKLITQLSLLNVDIKSISISAEAFHKHVAQCNYPKNYAAGPMDKGGLRDKKLLEYFVSLELLDVQQAEVVIDVASEWSIFPDVLRKLTDAVVYQQDLIYPPGIHGYRIGGNAAQMPLPDGFADKLVLHNAFEHFEGNADTEFIMEAWRVLKPGGVLCILPLYLAEEYHILTDPLVNRRGIVWDEGAQVIERPWWHNRFGRFYDTTSLDQRVLTQAKNMGFQSTIYHITNTKEVVAHSEMRFVLMLRKPGEQKQ
jgi:SAM-dependent methyltransferase